MSTPKHYLSEAEEFRAKYGLHPAISAEEISEVMGLAELGLLKTLCEPCNEGICQTAGTCWGKPCECLKCQEKQ